MRLGFITKGLAQNFYIEVRRVLNEREKQLAVFEEVKVVGGVEKLVSDLNQLEVELGVRLKSDNFLG